jgi:hypothetical protein
MEDVEAWRLEEASGQSQPMEIKNDVEPIRLQD